MSKWFDPQKRDIVPRQPVIQSPRQMTQEELVEFFGEIYSQASARTYGLLRRMALYEPQIRLGVNLRSLLDLLQTQKISDVSGGLKPDEIEALLELEDLHLPTEKLAVAQSLLNVHERVLMIELLKDSFDRCRAQRRLKLEVKPLDTD
jgi:hypothetical protein